MPTPRKSAKPPAKARAAKPVRGSGKAPGAAGTLPPEKQLAAFLAKFEPTIARRVRECRRTLRGRFPGAVEIVYDNYNFFVIGYSASERPSDCIVSLAANAKGVGLSFYHGATLPDPEGILLGSGSQNRFIRLPGALTLAEPAVDALIRAAVRQAKTPLPAKGGHLLIKSISAKQRPRREGAGPAGRAPGRPTRGSARG